MLVVCDGLNGKDIGPLKVRLRPDKADEQRDGKWNEN